MNVLSVRLRPIELADAAAVQTYAEDGRVAATTNIPHPYPPNGGQEFVERAVADAQGGRRYVFAIICNEQFAGTIGINGVNRQEGTASLDYGLAVSFWNKGIATAAAREAIGYAFSQLGLGALSSCCMKENKASARVLEKNGFVCIGEYIHDGKGKAEHQGKAMLRFQLLHDWLSW